MKKSILCLLFMALSGMFQPIQAQEESVREQIEQLQNEKEQIIQEEKEALKRKIQSINQRLENKEIKWEEAEKLKSEAAREHALNIRRRTEILDSRIAELHGESAYHPEDEDTDKDDWYSKSRYSRTSTRLVVATGFNNALGEEQSLNDSDFKIGGSRFFEIGLAWKTRVFERSNWLRLRYGFSFQFNGLKPTDNRYFVEEEDLTSLEEFPLELDKSKFRMDNLVFPVHFEIGPSKKVESARSVWFSTRNQFRIGVGGYAGVNLGERQKLKFSEEGEKVKEKLKGDYNTNEFIYGLSGYVGWGGTTLYAKYDLNPLFKDPNPELHNISLGLRFDIN